MNFQTLDVPHEKLNNLNKIGGKMAYEENNPGVFEFNEVDDEISGVLIKIQKDVGPSNSMFYTLESEGKPISIWGCAILDQRMLGIKEGDKIKVVYKGLGEAKAGQNAPKIFKVLVDRPEAEPIEEPED